ncbi:MAG: hypothetical protein AAFY28_02125 [Actinomycetota bacterium]
MQRSSPEPVDGSPLQMLEYWSPRTAAGVERVPESTGRALAALTLALRGIDEIEDHLELDAATKIDLLTRIGDACRIGVDASDVTAGRADLCQVSMRIDEWRAFTPPDLRPRIDSEVAVMAWRLAYWVERDWPFSTKTELDMYIYDTGVAYALAFDDFATITLGTQADRRKAVAMAVGAHLAHIVGDLGEDRDRGVDYCPDDWTDDDLRAYAKRMRPAIDEWRAQYEPGPFGGFTSAIFDGRY